MKKQFSVIYILIILFSFIACSENDNDMIIDETRRGKISLNVEIDMSVEKSISRAGETLSQFSESQLAFLQDFARNPEEKLRIQLISEDETYIQQWNNIKEFRKEEGFPLGIYYIVAWAGDEEIEDFNSPYVIGISSLVIKENETSTVNLIAGLQNALIGIDRTEEFDNYFDGFNAALTTSKGNVLNFGSDDTKDAIAYIQPGKVSVNVTVSLDGKVATVPVVTDFTALEASLQKIRLDVENTPETIILSVKFIGIEETEDIDIDITDKFEVAEAPSLLLDGIDSTTPLNIYEGNSAALQDKYRFNIEARGKMSAVTLKVESPLLTKDFNLFKSQDVAELTDIYGVKVLGIEENSMYGYVDITSWISSLQVKDASSDVETTVFTLIVEDTFSQQCTTNNSFTVNIYPERAILVSGYAEDKPVPADNMTFTLYTTIDNLEENPNRISLTTDNHNYGEESLSFLVKKVESDKAEYPFCYTLTVPTPAYKLDFYVKGQTSNGRSCGEPINLHRPVPMFDIEIPEDEITTLTANIYIKLQNVAEKSLFSRIISSEEGKLTIEIQDLQKSIQIEGSDFDDEGIALKVIEGLELGKSYEGEVIFGSYDKRSIRFTADNKLPKAIITVNQNDVFAKYATVHIELDETEEKRINQFNTYVNNGLVNLVVKGNGLAAEGVSIPVVFDDPDSPYSTIDCLIKDLSGNQTYSLELVNLEAQENRFTTEEELEIPNGSLSYTSTSSDYTAIYDFGVWGTNNQRTTYKQSSYACKGISGTTPNNDWISIKTIGWGDGNDVDESTNILRVTTYTYTCDNADAGLLHLGNNRDRNSSDNILVFDGQTTNGVDFKSRPQKISFDYYYEAKDYDAGYFLIALYDTNGNIIFMKEEKTLESSSQTNYSIDLNYENGTPSCSKLYIKFLSTTNSDYLQDISATRSTSLISPTDTRKSYFDYPSGESTSQTTPYSGSTLYIKNLKFEYLSE